MNVSGSLIRVDGLLWKKKADIFCLLGAWFYNKFKRYCYVYPLGQNQDLVAGLEIVSWLLLPCLCISFLPGWTTLWIPFGTQVRSWILKPIPYKQVWGTQRRLPCPGGQTKSCSVSPPCFSMNLASHCPPWGKGGLTFIFVISSVFSRRNSTQLLFIVVFRQVLCFLNCVIVRTVHVMLTISLKYSA